jgi:hypothetical protein
VREHGEWLLAVVGAHTAGADGDVG